ncbi:hypothetical protein TVAG_329930 [Trichomonas vaginalis G3]|uniref:Uncharacterized protein n=1 Tax=Trichomonas vaginalis (strain ATCC PRA-98 / G3) TaxID=412133 RepID=A2FQT9_TRIV3|nr:uncharacterized protein TVAGG3_1087210 [Trichomonas vaginalis G3]EAX92732.1 hypothetical protein TVAG_329930 [Trichomonas vaginalis G3]KAI5482355.1 hypothetical protein TVAGG3_1087210 [Trichomonas vaginalis G3]|eukprot:XP_001305662.1 hypothetical protein [Trichomonas vaginalis G3]
MPKNRKKHVGRSKVQPHTKKFLKDSEKETIIQLDSEGLDVESISEIINHTTRQVREFLKHIKNGIKNNFSIEQDLIIMSHVKNGDISAASIAKKLQDKDWWMVRNRIKLFRRKFPDFSLLTQSEVVRILHQNEKPNELDDAMSLEGVFDFPDDGLW